jgi:hypothetical protein
MTISVQLDDFSYHYPLHDGVVSFQTGGKLFLSEPSSSASAFEFEFSSCQIDDIEDTSIEVSSISLFLKSFFVCRKRNLTRYSPGGLGARLVGK